MPTVKRDMLVAIISGFENITRFNLEILLEESGWGPYWFPLDDYQFWRNLLVLQFQQINLSQ